VVEPLDAAITGGSIAKHRGQVHQRHTVQEYLNRCFRVNGKKRDYSSANTPLR